MQRTTTEMVAPVVAQARLRIKRVEGKAKGERSKSLSLRSGIRYLRGE